jgi:heavy metal translocating P-type ATPase
MESLIFIASLSAYLYSLYRMSQASLHLYFDTASMLITLVLLGRWIEIHVRGRVAGGITGLYQLTRQKVRLLDRERERWVSSDAVSPGDLFVVFAGERVPLDGKVLEGRGDMDESVLTGEPRPVPKDPGDEVKAGAFLISGEIKVRTTRTGRESSLGQIVALMQEALDKKNPAEIMADRITRWFVPTILAIAGATSLYLWFLSSTGDEVFLRSLAVLAIACPCSLGIATPIVKLASVGLAKSQGMLVRDPAALETMKDLDVLVFDKTGTLTEGHFHLQDMVTDEGMAPGRALSLIASLEVHSDHFLAKEILRKAREKSLKLEEVEGFEALEGMGVKGRVGSQEIFIGNRKWMVQKSLEIPAAIGRRAEESEIRGMTAIFAGWEGKVHSLLLFGDSLRKGIREMVEGLHGRGIKTWIVSGDSRATTESVSRQSGIPEFLGEALPQDKVELIRNLQGKGRRVGMVGDGINDAAALAQADVGFALGAGSNILQEASDFTLLSSDPVKVLDALDLSSKTVGAIRQNLFFAFLYNSVGIPLAMAGWLNPLIAVFAMFASSLTVIGNALRISRGKRL